MVKIMTKGENELAMCNEILGIVSNLDMTTPQIFKRNKNMSENKTVYCPYCNQYGMESQDEDSAVCPECGANAQWEDEVLLCVEEE